MSKIKELAEDTAVAVTYISFFVVLAFFTLVPAILSEKAITSLTGLTSAGYATGITLFVFLWMPALNMMTGIANFVGDRLSK